MSKNSAGWSLLWLLLWLLPCTAGWAQETQVIDDFEGQLAWTAHPADGVTLRISQESQGEGQSLRLDYSFTGGGYAIARLASNIELTGNYAFRFRLRGQGPPNHLEFKLVDRSGENVWWKVRRDVKWPAQWREFSYKKRQFDFAWGPQGGGEIKTVGAIELAITASAGGTGTVWLDDLELVALPPVDLTPPPPVAEASSAAGKSVASHVLNDDYTAWWAPAAGDEAPTVGLDFQLLREYGGLIVDWQPGHPVPDYVVEASSSTGDWQTLQTVTGSNGGRDYLYLPESESRRLRLRLIGPRVALAAVARLTLKPLAWSATRATFFEAIAADELRGTLPRGFLNEQVYWTVVGVDADNQEGLLSEDGALEVGRGGFTIEPFLFVDGELITWDDVVREQSLVDHELPLPSVTWFYDGPGHNDLRLRVQVYGWGEPGASSLLARYRLENLGDRRREVTLYQAVRPFQVNPPSQSLNLPGGTATITAIEKTGLTISVNGQPAVLLQTKPTGFGATPFFGGEVVQDYLRRGKLPDAQRVTDDFGAASAAAAYRYDLAAGESRSVDIVLPLHNNVPTVVDPDVVAYAARERWRSKLGKVTISGPAAATETIETLKAQLGYILVNRAGPSLQPGSRSYARSWIRDGALTSWALLQMGLKKPVEEFLRWYAPHQYANGKVPCVVDSRGADPVPEHDSNGEFIFLVAQYYRYTGDRELLGQMWPRVLSAATYLDSLRQQRRTADYQAPARHQFYGLLPPSISHEGYSAKPMHSYWDDFFALRGFRDAEYLAGVLAHPDDRKRLGRIRAQFETDLGASVSRTMAVHKINYIPGCADLGDFDPTSTTIALAPADAYDLLPPRSLENTFERYYQFFRKREAGDPWQALTPYEVRNIGAFVRLGWRERANELLDFFLAYRRPPGWRQWAEVVFQDKRAAHFIGDMPHTWVGSDFIRSVLDMFVFEQAAAESPAQGSARELVLGAGLPLSWLAAPGVTLGNLATPYGELNYTLYMTAGNVVMEIAPSLEIPDGGLVLDPPLPAGVSRAEVNGELIELTAGSRVVVRHLPALVTWR